MKSIGIASVILFAALALVADAAAQCHNVVKVERSVTCDGPFTCACPGALIDTTRVKAPLPGGGSVEVGVKFGSDEDSTANCCSVVIVTPEHGELTSGIFEVQFTGAVTGYLSFGTCETECTSFLGIYASGRAVCSYDELPFGLYSIYAKVSLCPFTEL